MDRLQMESQDVAKRKYEEFISLFPGAITETTDDRGNLIKAINTKNLREELNLQTLEERQESYILSWPDKNKMKLEANLPTRSTLRPYEKESLFFDRTKNLYLEGDNLEILKIMQETYLGKIKLIYIDPPYNTGKDFIYNDNFYQDKKNYDISSNQYDYFGNRLISNLENSGRFHTNWLNMIYPRLLFARDLLKENGLIFISISEKELANLLKVGNEIFGEKNFVEIFSWQKTSTPPNLSLRTKKSIEYIVCFKKGNIETLKGLVKYSKSTNGLMNQSNSVKELVFRKEWTETSIEDGQISKGMYGSDAYDIELLNNVSIKNGKFVNDVRLRGKFKWSQKYLEEEVKNGTKIYIKTKILSPSYDKVDYEPEKPWNLIDKSFGVGTNENASDEVDLLFNKNFSENLYPKPTTLIKYLMSMIDLEEEIVLDFFSGSATTAHAVMELNAEDGGNRKFIMVQLPEETDQKSEAYKSGYKYITDIGKERIRRAGKKILENNKDKEGIEKLDIGFRVLKLDSSNMKDIYYTPQDTQQSVLEDLTDNIKEDRSELDLLFQVMLDLGVELSSTITEIDISGKKVFSVSDKYLLATFDKDIDEKTITEIAKRKPVFFVMRDASLTSDSVATNFEQIFNTYSPDTTRKVI